MRHTHFLAATTLLAFLLAVPVSPQAAQTGAQNTPQALKATYDQAMQAKDWPAALAAAQQLVDANATSANLFLLANAQLYATTGQQDTGPLEACLATYDRALAAAEQEKPAEGQPDAAWRDLVAKIDVGKGNAYLKLRRNSDAIAMYTQAAEIAPNPAVAYWNLCATLYNTGDTQNATVACRKDVDIDPANANAWFVLGTILYAGAKLDAQGNFAITAECRDALNKYLQLAPNGPHAADVKAMLQMADQ